MRKQHFDLEARAVTDPHATADANTGTSAQAGAQSGAAAPLQRRAQVIRLRPECAEEYLRLHRAVWPEVLATISGCNIRNYSIYLHGDLLISYFEYVGTDYAADMARMAADPATQRWWKLTDPCQEQTPDAAPGEWWTVLPEVFHHE
jgi:L-rhamnose mutarotase